MRQTQSLSIPGLFAQALERSRQKIALRIRNNSVWSEFSYQQIDQISKKISAFLIKTGFKNGDRVALILEGQPEWPIIYLSIVSAGLTCVPLDPDLGPEEIENLLLDASCVCAFVSVDSLYAKLTQKIKDRLKKIIVLGLEEGKSNQVSFSSLDKISIDDLKLPEINSNDVASLIYTSGTTAKPKGVLLTHYNLCSNFHSLYKLKLCSSKDNFLSILPLYHTYAFMITVLLPLSSGASVTYCRSLKSEDIIQTIKESRVTLLVGVPQLFSLLHRGISKKTEKIPLLLKPLTSILLKAGVSKVFGRDFKAMVCGGARLDPKVVSGLSRFFKFIEGYGLTETSPVVTINSNTEDKPGSVGKAISGVEIKILNPDQSGVGEVLVKGSNVMQGYFKQPELTQEVIKEDWFYTGDLGFLDKDGFLFLTGRAKDVIVLSSGKNIYPEELEEHYLKSPFIKEICILDRKEERFGSSVDFLYAVIVPDFAYFRESTQINIKDRIREELEILSRQLPTYQHLMGFVMSKEELPRTRLKKLIRYKIAQQYLNDQLVSKDQKKVELSDTDERLLSSEIAKKIIDHLSKELKRPVGLFNHLEIDLGIDSLTRVELILSLENLLKIKIPENIVYDVQTVKELILFLKEQVSSMSSSEGESLNESQKWIQILSNLPKESVLKKIHITTGFWAILVNFVFKYIFLLIFKFGWSLKIEGAENIPLKGRYIICANHASYLDAPMLSIGLPFKKAIQLFFFGHAKIFEHPLAAWTVKLARIISVDPSVHLIEAMQAASFVLKNNRAVCIFPEGGRSSNEKIADFKKGAAILAKELNATLIPANIIGSHYSWPITSKFPKPYPVRIVFGKPLRWQELGTNYEQITKNLREKVIKLGK